MEARESEKLIPPLPPEDDLRFQNLREELQKAVNDPQRKARLESDFPWITVFSDNDREMTCVQYTFGPGEIGDRNAEVVYRTYTPIEDGNLVNGDFVFYKNQHGDIVHVGIMRDGGKVESKWGKGPVVLSPLRLVPVDYGNSVIGFRKPDDNVSNVYFQSGQDRNLQKQHT